MPGRQQRGSDAYDRYTRFSEAPMTVLAFLMIPVLLVPLIRPVHGAVAVSFDLADDVIWALFGFDYGTKLWLAPDRFRFVRTHLVDLAVVALPFLRPLRALRALRGLGELRMLRLLQASRLVAFLGTGIGHARAIIQRKGLHYVAVVVIAIMFASAGLEVAFESHAKGSNIHSYGDALWWALVTVTSVGYGDRYPVTASGRAVAVVLMITGIALFGVVTASIASYFVEQDQDRRMEERVDEILTVLHRLEARLDASERLSLASSEHQAPAASERQGLASSERQGLASSERQGLASSEHQAPTMPERHIPAAAAEPAPGSSPKLAPRSSPESAPRLSPSPVPVPEAAPASQPLQMGD
jgi:voltage-gated potassium channel